MNENGDVLQKLPQFGGVKGEHNATRFQITMTSPTVYKDGDIARLEFYGGDGTVLSSDILDDVTVDGTHVSLWYEIPKMLTMLGGQLCVRLVLSRMDDSDNEIETFRSGEMVLWFEDAHVENGMPFWTGVSEMLRRTVSAKEEVIAVQKRTEELLQSHITNSTKAVSGKLSKSGHTPNRYLVTDENGNVVTATPPSGGSGANGKSAYEIAVEQGFEGDEAAWLASLKGTDGKDGVNGIDGKNGVDGRDGADGKDYVLTEADKAEIAAMVTVSKPTQTVSFLETATKTDGAYARWSTSSGMVKESAATVWSYYRGDVEAGTEYQLKAYTVGDAYAVMFLNESGGLVSTVPTTQSTTGELVDLTITVPDGAVTMIVNEQATILNGSFGLDGVVVESETASGTTSVANGYLAGKVLLACGDSITDAYDLASNNGSYVKSYAQLAAERLGMIYRKDAVSGSTMAYNADSDASAASAKAFSNTRYQNLPAFDYLTLWFGWNDGAYSTLGTIEDTDNTTFCGAYKTVLEHLVTTYPTKKIGVVVPKLKPNQSLIDPEALAQAVRDVSKLYGVPCLDLADYNACSSLWSVDNAAQQARNTALTFDGTHPNRAGHEYLSTMYEAFLKRL